MPCRIHSYLSSYFPNLPLPLTPPTHSLTFFFSSSEYPISQRRRLQNWVWGREVALHHRSRSQIWVESRGRPRADPIKAVQARQPFSIVTAAAAPAGLPLSSLSEGRHWQAWGRGPPSGYVGWQGFLEHGVAGEGVAWGIERMGEMWGKWLSLAMF